MFNRLRRRTMAPSRPLVYPAQVGLWLFSVIAIVGGIYVVVRVRALDPSGPLRERCGTLLFNLR